ncbi:MAG: peptide/nickel transport system permease protein [Tepidanaerobacteraceae bacterium]|nr:peptide/nickel transport system permease protein [Tepidanaerobacteraceae bacterium]
MSDLLEYAVRKLIIGAFVVFVVTVVLFCIMQLMPGDPIQLISNPRIPPEKIAELKKHWGLDKPVYVQYFYWLFHILQGDFGTSITTGQKVITLIQERLPYTLLLAGGSLIFQYIIAIPIGLMAAYKEHSIFDSIVVVSTIIFWSIPSFWLGILLILIFSLKLKLLPVSGYDGLSSLILPLMTATLPNLASTLRLTRSEVLEVLREKYVSTAYAKGLSEKRVLIFHVLRNALIPVTLMFFLYLPWTVGGAVIIETIFSWPGMGRLLWTAISSQDFPVV